MAEELDRPNLQARPRETSGARHPERMTSDAGRSVRGLDRHSQALLSFDNGSLHVILGDDPTVGNSGRSVCGTSPFQREGNKRFNRPSWMFIAQNGQA